MKAKPRETRHDLALSEIVITLRPPAWWGDAHFDAAVEVIERTQLREAAKLFVAERLSKSIRTKDVEAVLEPLDGVGP